MCRIKIINLVYFCLFMVFSLFVFRIRDYGSSDVDYQIIFRFSAWSFGTLIAVFYFYKYGFNVVSAHELLLIMFLVLALFMLPFSILPLRSFVVLLSYASFYLYIKYIKDRFGDEYLLYAISVAFFIVLFSSYLYYFAFPDLGRHIYWLADVLYISPK